MTRLFVCVDPSPAAVADLGAVVDGLEVARANAPGHSTRMAARGRWHITLAFLGDIPDDRVDRAAEALTAAAADLRPVTVQFAGGGTFGRGGFTILWAGIGGDVDGLRALAQAVRAQLRRRRIPFDAKAFRPHVTISRPGARVASDLLEHDVATLEAYAGAEWTVAGLHLVSSQLGPNPVYTTVASVQLAG